MSENNKKWYVLRAAGGKEKKAKEALEASEKADVQWNLASQDYTKVSERANRALEILKKTLGICLLVFSARYGILTMVALKSAMDFLCTVINAWPNRKLLGYGPLRQWKDVLPEFFAALVMGLLVAALQRLLPLGAAGKLILQIGAGVLIYGGIAAVFRLESFSYCLETLRQLMEKRRNRS